MIITQTITELGHPDWELHGACLMDDECDTGNGGYGLSPQTALDKIARRLSTLHGAHAHIVGAKIEIGAGRAHPDYGRTHVWVQGDLYIEKHPEQRRSGLVELSPQETIT